MKILLIEDNADHAALVQAALADHDVVHVDRLQTALETYLPQFEAVLTDLTLPDCHGIETVHRLRSRAPGLPVVILTSLADDQIAESAIEQGAQDYLAKEDFLSDARTARHLLTRTLRYAKLRDEATQENRRLVASLRHSKALLERKNERLRQVCETAQRFVENVSHDFRTPLTVIKEYSALIRDGVVGEVNAEQRRMLNVVEDRADDLNTMVDDLLDVSKFEAGLLNVWRRKTSLARIVRHVMPGLERKALVRGVVLTTAVSDDLPEIFCDEEKVGRVIVNLVSNAIKFCSEGGRIELWGRSSDPSREVAIGVTDNGPGIPQDKLQQIFDRFEQASTHSPTTAKGFGLGLSIARELADLNLGRMEVQSTVGQGSTFSFTVPVADHAEIFARYVRRLRSRDGDAAACTPITIFADESRSTKDFDDLDIFLSHNIRGDDLALRIGRRQWLVVVYASPLEVDGFIQRARRELADFNRNCPLGSLPEIEFRIEESLSLNHSLAELQSEVAPLLEPLEACCV